MTKQELSLYCQQRLQAISSRCSLAKVFPQRRLCSCRRLSVARRLSKESHAIVSWIRVSTDDKAAEVRPKRTWRDHTTLAVAC